MDYHVSGYSPPFRVRLWDNQEGFTYNTTTVSTIDNYEYAEWNFGTGEAYIRKEGVQRATLYEDSGGSFVGENFGWLSSEWCHGDLLIDTTNDVIKNAAENIRSESITPYAVAKNVAIWMAERVMYGKPSGLPSNQNKTPTEVLDTGEGDCIELSTLYASLCRAAGVPTRVVWGITENKTNPFGHVWTEFYDGEKWIRVDMTDLIMYHSGPAQAALGPVSDWFGFVDSRDVTGYVEDASESALQRVYTDTFNFEDGLPSYTRSGTMTVQKTATLKIYNTGRRELVFSDVV